MEGRGEFEYVGYDHEYDYNDEELSKSWVLVSPVWGIIMHVVVGMIDARSGTPLALLSREECLPSLFPWDEERHWAEFPEHDSDRFPDILFTIQLLKRLV